jgi:hypothetical protein
MFRVAQDMFNKMEQLTRENEQLRRELEEQQKLNQGLHSRLGQIGIFSAKMYQENVNK